MISQSAAHGELTADPLHHQFEDIEQQNETYLVGMWVFLVTEVMFFGAMFFAYTLYRWQFQSTFYEAHQELNLTMGTANTVVLLTSSLSMALAVHFAQLKRRFEQILLLLVTMALACTFLVVKFFEWKAKFDHGLVPGPNFIWHGQTPSGHAQMFFSLYFAMTGLHALHVIIGVIVIGALTLMTLRKHRLVESYIPNEMIGLYWHFVDIVWIFLFPLFYLIPS